MTPCLVLFELTNLGRIEDGTLTCKESMSAVIRLNLSPSRRPPFVLCLCIPHSFLTESPRLDTRVGYTIVGLTNPHYVSIIFLYMKYW